MIFLELFRRFDLRNNGLRPLMLFLVLCFLDLFRALGSQVAIGVLDKIDISEIDLSKRFVYSLKVSGLDQNLKYCEKTVGDGLVHSVVEAKDIFNHFGEWKNIHLISFSIFRKKDMNSYLCDCGYLVELEKSSVLVRMNFIKNERGFFVHALKAQPCKTRYAELFNFPFTGKSLFQFGFLMLGLFLFLFNVFAISTAFGTKGEAKWIWIFVMAFGFFKAQLPWDNFHISLSMVEVDLRNVSFLSFDLFKNDILSPWVIRLSAPIGAVVFFATKWTKKILFRTLGQTS